ncbi:DMT family transporter [Roseovarius sp. EL26]|uniref:DMT family transporter n=1 Tax=Roseovarius sp. EL26 TaxID=2126672 RepID=UPI000EA05940|nr:DMT family transporter [Roseovarius sp. EL26]
MSLALLIIVVLSWGFSWYAIELQIGEIPALVSITYRFVLSTAMLVLFLLLSGRFRRIPLKDHGLVAALGFCLFSMNFFCMYLAAGYFPSGLLSVIFATAAIMGAFNQKLFFGKPLNSRVLLGAAAGLIGLVLLSWDDIIGTGGIPPLFIALPFIGTYLFSLGNLLSARLSRDHDLPNIVAYGMGYGALICLAVCLMAGLPFPIPQGATYWGAMIYLSGIASVLAFLTYLNLVKREGPARAAYATVLFPIVAMLVSTWLEGFEWTVYSALGLIMALGGTALVFKRPKAAQFSRV